MNRRGNKKGGILLVHPPAAKICEAPGGPARLAGTLRRHGVVCRIWDANLEGQLALLGSAARASLEGGRDGTVRPGGRGGCEEDPIRPERGEGLLRGRKTGWSSQGGEAGDVWTRRAARHLVENLSRLRSWELYTNSDRYRRAVTDVNRLLATAARPYGVRLSLADYEDDRLSPLRSADLVEAAAVPDTNPFHPWFRERLPEVLEETPVSHVGFSLNYLSQALTVFAMIGLLRRECPSLRIVLGGGLVTSWMRSPAWCNPFAGLVDEMIAGPGEGPLLVLLGRNNDDGDGRPDLDGFPRDYLSPGAVLPYSASSGCWWRRCSFCPERAEGTPYQPLTPRRVTEDLRALTEQVRPALIHLLDNALSPLLLRTLAGNPPGAPWYGFARITSCLADPEFGRRLRDSGCVMLKLGLESGDHGVLAALKKGITPALAAAVLANLKEAGIATYVYLLFGTPAETPAAAARTLAFTAVHAEQIGFLNLAVFNLPAYGPETEGLITGAFYEGDLSLYRRFAHPRGWDRGAIRRFLEKDFKKEPAIAAILRRDPPFFTSNHAPFLVMA